MVAARGGTSVRSRTGRLLHRFPSPLPGGSPASAGRAAFTMLDCVFQPDDLGAAGGPGEVPGTLHVLDLLAWRGQDVAGSAADFRLFWLASKMQEEVGGEAGGGSGGGNDYDFYDYDFYY